MEWFNCGCSYCFTFSTIDSLPTARVYVTRSIAFVDVQNIQHGLRYYCQCYPSVHVHSVCNFCAIYRYDNTIYRCFEWFYLCLHIAKFIVLDNSEATEQADATFYAFAYNHTNSWLLKPAGSVLYYGSVNMYNLHLKDT